MKTLRFFRTFSDGEDIQLGDTNILVDGKTAKIQTYCTVKYPNPSVVAANNVESLSSSPTYPVLKFSEETGHVSLFDEGDNPFWISETHKVNGAEKCIVINNMSFYENNYIIDSAVLYVIPIYVYNTDVYSFTAHPGDTFFQLFNTQQAVFLSDYSDTIAVFRKGISFEPLIIPTLGAESMAFCYLPFAVLISTLETLNIGKVAAIPNSILYVKAHHKFV